LGAALAVTLLTVVATTAQAAAFGPAFAVSGANAACGFLSEPQVALDADGDAVFTWERRDANGKLQIQARRRSANGVFGPILTLSGRSEIVLFHRLAVDAGGDALIAWTVRPEAGPDQAQYRAFSAAGVLGPVELLSNVLPTDNAQVAMNPQGQAIFAWRRPNAAQNTAAIEVRVRSGAGVLGPIQRVSFSGQLTFQPDVAISRNGDAVVAWVRQFGSKPLVEARRRSAAGELEEIRQNLDQGDFPQVAIDREGDAIITWTDRRSRPRVQMRTLSATNGIGPRQQVSQGTGVALQIPQLAMNDRGDAVISFLQAGPAGFGAKARARAASGVFTPSQTIAQQALQPFVVPAIDARGRSVFAWTLPANATVTFTRVQARRRSATGSLGGVQTLSPPGAAASPRVATNAAGDAAISWCQTDEEGKVRVFGAVTPTGD
jgi:hypothetical protein